jgi:RNA polymerase sigma-70 factor (ECF subfamily)
MNPPPDPVPPEVVERMQEIVQLMPRLTRDIFLAHRLDGLPYAEIARRTGLTVRQVERRMARALVLLDRSLHDRRPWWKFW